MRSLFSLFLLIKKKSHPERNVQILHGVRFTLVLGRHLATLGEEPHASEADICVTCLGIDGIREQHTENIRIK